MVLKRYLLRCVATQRTPVNFNTLLFWALLQHNKLNFNTFQQKYPESSVSLCSPQGKGGESWLSLFYALQFGRITSSQAPRCASWKADKLKSSRQDKLTSWQDEKLTSWQDDKMTRWQVDKLTIWQVDKMTRWQVDKLTRWKDDKMTRWQADKLTSKKYLCQK